MFRIIDYQATEPVSKVDQIRPIPIPHSPRKVILATIRITIPQRDANNNHVELIATVGVRGATGTSQILFKIFRDGKEIFRSQEGVESDPTSEVNYIVTVQAIDTNVRGGSHTYQVTAENRTNGTEAAVVGPISFSGLAIARDKDDDNDHDKDHDRDQDRDMERDTRHEKDREQDKNRESRRERNNDRDRHTSRDREQNRNRRIWF